MADRARGQQWAEDELNVASVAGCEVEYGEDGTGRATYRHVTYTDWQVVPDA